MSEAAPGPIRLVVSDIDGTLVRHDKSLPDANVAAMRDLVARGVKVSLISARPPAGMRPIIEALGLEGPCGAFNGGTLFTADGTVLSAKRIAPEIARDLLAQFEQAGVTRWVFADGRWLTSAIDDLHTGRERLSSGLEPVTGADFAAAAHNADKIVAVSDDADLLRRVEETARHRAGSEATVIRSQAYYLDVTAPAANKGNGITALAARFDVPLGETAAFGDQANDIAMFERAGLAVAMGQASAEVQAAADCVAATNEDAGVADAIARYVLPRLG